jgi:hypothetical protein
MSIVGADMLVLLFRQQMIKALDLLGAQALAHVRFSADWFRFLRSLGRRAMQAPQVSKRRARPFRF